LPRKQKAATPARRGGRCEVRLLMSQRNRANAPGIFTDIERPGFQQINADGSGEGSLTYRRLDYANFH
jgi:hypothetical protein